MKKVLRTLVILIVLAGIAALIVRYYFRHGTFYYAGTLETTKVDLSARLTSTLAKVIPQEGDPVKTKDTLIELTCDDVKNANIFAQDNYKRYVKLTQSGTSTPEVLDQMRDRKQDSDIRLSWCSIQSPIDGTVLSRYHEPGEWVTSGTRILTVADAKDVWTYFYVPQPMLARLSLGKKVQAFLPEIGIDTKFQGTIVKINEEAEFTPKNVQTREERSRLVYGIKVNFKESNQKGILKPGMTLETELAE